MTTRTLPRVTASLIGVGALTATALTTLAAPANAALPGNCTQAAQTVTCIYGFIGAAQTFAVPTGVSTLTITAVGAGSEAYQDVPGARGATVTAPVAVSPGSALTVYVGGVGKAPTGFTGGAEFGQRGYNGGGVGKNGSGGGGASDVRTSSADPSTEASLQSRLIVAGGAGGPTKYDGSGQTETAFGGDAGADAPGPTGGKAGTQTTGGAGGEGFGANAQSGARGTGGNASDQAGGGAGGGGLYGGGGGYIYGGGGGSSLPATTAVTSDPAKVVIVYTATTASCSGISCLLQNLPLGSLGR
jgi:hypothetical protein